MYLEYINDIKDIKNLNVDQLNVLANEIRNLIIKVVSKNGGHLASNLGVVELTLAIHKVFDSPKDKIIWDVGHQSYVHKIITGRRDKFNTIRQFGGLSGFPKRNESYHDIFETGHSSTSISAGLGYALARDIKNEKFNVVSIIGDGALTAGMAFEALNQAGDIGTKLIVILNDNEMSISKNVGGLSRYLNRIRTKPSYFKVKEDVGSLLNSIPKIGDKVYKTAERAKDSIKYFFVPGMFFEEIGFKYLGPVDGHNINDLIDIFDIAKKIKGPTLIHVITKKGKGYKPAENNPDKYHSAPKFDIKTGKIKNKSIIPSYSDVLGDTLVELANKDERIVAITAAMPTGTGLYKFSNKYPNRFFDVGIAEQHGVTLAAGLAANGMKPYFAVYSTFLQRGYDQVLHDVCLQNLNVTFAIDRAGLVGNDGETHQGVFDLSYLSHIPNITIIAPKDKKEFISMLKFTTEYNGPIAIRYPKGKCVDLPCSNNSAQIKYAKGEILNIGNNIAIIAVGKMVQIGFDALKMLNKEGINITLVNARFVKPLDIELLEKIAENHKIIITMEDNVKIGGFGSAVNDFYIERKYSGKIINIAYPDIFIEHGSIDQLLEKYNMDAKSIAELVKKYC